ncbi:Holin of 3TMs, for gene-transfer release, partial [uncultured Caudovirales phage]
MFPLGAVLDIGSKILDKVFPDPAQAEAAKLKLLEMQQNGELAQLAAATDIAKLQIQTNLEEAKSTNWFVAGWRPFVGWVCAVALGYVAVLEPI